MKVRVQVQHLKARLEVDFKRTCDVLIGREQDFPFFVEEMANKFCQQIFVHPQAMDKSFEVSFQRRDGWTVVLTTSTDSSGVVMVRRFRLKEGSNEFFIEQYLTREFKWVDEPESLRSRTIPEDALRLPFFVSN